MEGVTKGKNVYDSPRVKPQFPSLPVHNPVTIQTGTPSLPFTTEQEKLFSITTKNSLKCYIEFPVCTTSLFLSSSIQYPVLLLFLFVYSPCFSVFSSFVFLFFSEFWCCTRVGTLIVATIYLQLIQNRYMFRSFLSFSAVTSIVYNPLPAMWKS